MKLMLQLIVVRKADSASRPSGDCENNKDNRRKFGLEDIIIANKRLC